MSKLPTPASGLRPPQSRTNLPAKRGRQSNEDDEAENETGKKPRLGTNLTKSKSVMNIADSSSRVGASNNGRPSGIRPGLLTGTASKAPRPPLSRRQTSLALNDRTNRFVFRKKC